MIKPDFLQSVPYLLNKVRRDKGSLIHYGWSSNREERWRVLVPNSREPGLSDMAKILESLIKTVS
jgi:hypothetical protein